MFPANIITALAEILGSAGAAEAGAGGISGLLGGAGEGITGSGAEGIVRSGPPQLLAKGGSGNAAVDEALNAWIGSPERTGLVKQHGIGKVQGAEAKVPFGHFKGGRLKDIMQMVQSYIK